MLTWSQKEYSTHLVWSEWFISDPSLTSQLDMINYHLAFPPYGLPNIWIHQTHIGDISM
jgi:hypothetical protein